MKAIRYMLWFMTIYLMGMTIYVFCMLPKGC